MKVCYCDASGTGDEPIAVMAGIVVDSTRMHVTKDHWEGLLFELSKIVGRRIRELHTREFYPGNGVWRGLRGPQRAKVIDHILKWFADRKHHTVYSAISKSIYSRGLKNGDIPAALKTPWRFLGFHLILSMQRRFQGEEKRKGDTIFIFDNEEREEKRFIDLLRNPPKWSDSYYSKKTNQQRLNKIVDVPYFGDSQDVALIQVADFIAFFLRRYAEIQDGLVPLKYEDEGKKINIWATAIGNRSIGRNYIYPKAHRCKCADMFFKYSPPSIRDL